MRTLIVTRKSQFVSKKIINSFLRSLAGESSRMGESLRIESKMTAKVSDDDLKEINKKAIVKMNDLLAKTMDCTKYFPYLRSRSILDADDCEEIEAERTRRKKTFKFLAVLEEKSNYNLETVKRLIEAVSQDYTVPGLRDRMIDIFADARKDYLKKQGRRMGNSSLIGKSR